MAHILLQVRETNNQCHQFSRGDWGECKTQALYISPHKYRTRVNKTFPINVSCLLRHDFLYGWYRYYIEFSTTVIKCKTSCSSYCFFPAWQTSWEKKMHSVGCEVCRHWLHISDWCLVMLEYLINSCPINCAFLFKYIRYWLIKI